MWELKNKTPYGAERNWIRDKTGRHHWVVAVKATFRVEEGGRLVLADEQVPPALAPEYSGEPGVSSLRWDSDLLYVKPCTDVIAEAHAHAPYGRPATGVAVSMRVGPISKALLVHGDRVFMRDVIGITTTSPLAFVSRPITYEWSFGGFDTAHENPRRHRIFDRNPIGKGFAVDRARLVDQPAPAVEAPGQDPEKSEPAGLGAIDPSWMPRRARAGTYDERWAATKKPLLPDDYDDLFASCAPTDQRPPGWLRGGEPVELIGVTRSGVSRFALPAVRFGFTTYFGSRKVEHDGALATVLLQPEESLVSLVWQSTLYVPPRDDEYLDHTFIEEKPWTP
jgi:hypothetical protein